MEIKTGLWKHESKKGNKYCSGKFKLDDKEYYLTLFNNNKKDNEKAPDFNLIIRDSINTQEEIKTVEIPPKNDLDDQIFADFGSKIEFSENDLPF